MKFSLEWLKKYLDTTATVNELADAMVQLGIEVEAIENEADNFNNVVIGHVISRTPHPDADRLGVCIVDVGEENPRQIVCGAPNARDGITVAVALEGAILPGNFEIKPTKIRGLKSNGMICSVRELGLGDEHEGIMELAVNDALGTAFSESQRLTGTVFDVSITPNRGDALSVYGIARDLAALGVGKLQEVEVPEIGSTDPIVKAGIETSNCLFFSGISITGIKNQASPIWMQKLLLDAGLRPISAVVDVTNYINIGLGQPLHSYDADKVKGTVYAGDAKGGEKYLALDENEYILSDGDLGIFDDSGLIGLGGIMGGETTSVDENTTNIYLEAAWFDRSRIARTGQDLQIISDARHRFERGIDPAMTPVASKIAANLIVEFCGGVVSGMEKLGSNVKEVPTIDFDPSLVKTFGGLEVETSEITQILNGLGFAVSENGANLYVTPPSFRTYMETPEDLVEEVLRMKGYDEVPTVLPHIPLNAIRDAAQGLTEDRTSRRTLASLGYLECINYSFISETKAKMFAEGAKVLTLANPIDEETMSTMRPSIVPSLLDAAVNI